MYSPGSTHTIRDSRQQHMATLLPIRMHPQRRTLSVYGCCDYVLDMYLEAEEVGKGSENYITDLAAGLNSEVRSINLLQFSTTSVIM